MTKIQMRKRCNGRLPSTSDALLIDEEIQRNYDQLRKKLHTARADRCATSPRSMISDFTVAVWAACSTIPRGRVTTYKSLASMVQTFLLHRCGHAMLKNEGLPTRAVGQALKKNPFAPQVPCHRVVRSDRTLGGFAGCTSGSELYRKIDLLRSEGIRIDGTNPKIVSADQFLQ